MEIKKQEVTEMRAIKLIAYENDMPIGRAYLYLLHNDLHEEPFGLMEDVFVEQEHRGNGVGKSLVLAVIEEAKNQGCYKLLGTSRHTRPQVHNMYEKLGFTKWGEEFRMDFLII